MAFIECQELLSQGVRVKKYLILDRKVGVIPITMTKI